ncbi:MAG: sulfatase-like hydrolase/transferase [Janthinobacterium lividum]
MNGSNKLGTTAVGLGLSQSPALRRARAFLGGQSAVRLTLASTLPGLPFIMVRALLHQHSGIFNIDFFLITGLAASGYLTLASVLFVVVYVLESIRLLDAVYFFSQQDALFAMHFLADTPRFVGLAWLVAFLALTAGSFQLWRALIPKVSRRRLIPGLLLLSTLLAVAATVDLTQGYNPLLVRAHGRARPHLVGEVLVRMPLELSRSVSHDQGSTELSHSATDPLWGASPVRTNRENVVVVVVESMGLLTDVAARARQLNDFQYDSAIQSRYAVTVGSVPFTGATVPGEMRELCHLQSTVHVSDATLDGKPPCLPQQFRGLGYETASFHGYRGAMFLREKWYPTLGFESSDFLTELKDLPTCSGAFYGACDSAIASHIEQRLATKHREGGPPQFLYWMTLTSHLPVDVSNAPAKPCPITADTEVCAQLAYIGVVLDSVKKLALDESTGPTAIVVVGDHAPPYASMDRRDLFDSNSVPYIVLLPKATK